MVIFEQYKKVFKRINNQSNIAIYIIDIDLGGGNTPYGVMSCVNYANIYNLDVVVMKEIDKKYNIPYFERKLNNYYAVTSPQICSLQELFDDYQAILFIGENDIIMTPYFPNIKNVGNSSLLYLTQYEDLVELYNKQSIEFYNKSLTQKEIDWLKQRQNILHNEFDLPHINALTSLYGNLIYKKNNWFTKSVYQQFILKGFRLDGQLNYMFWDYFLPLHFIQGYYDGQFTTCIKLSMNQSTKHYTSIMNNIKISKQKLKCRLTDNLYLVHCQGGGNSIQINNIRNLRMKYVYQYYWQ